jgi:hypothetical protein
MTKSLPHLSVTINSILPLLHSFVEPRLIFGVYETRVKFVVVPREQLVKVCIFAVLFCFAIKY